MTFLRAFQAVNNSPTNSAQVTERTVSRKQLKLTIVFFIMFVAFAVVYIPLLIFLHDETVKNDIPFTILMWTSVLNPILTLYFKKEFRPRNEPSRVDVGKVNIKTSTVTLNQIKKV